MSIQGHCQNCTEVQSHQQHSGYITNTYSNRAFSKFTLGPMNLTAVVFLSYCFLM